MTTQHYRITLADAIEHYKKNWITSTALLYYYLRIRLAPKWKCTIHQKEITKKLGIPKTSFYRAIENLSKQGLINWEAANGLMVSLSEDRELPDEATQCPEEISKEEIYTDDRSYESEESESSDENIPSTIDGKKSHEWDSIPTDGKKSHEWDSIPTDETTSPTNGNESSTDGTNASEKVRNNKTSSDPSNYYQIFINSLSKSEKEKFLNLIDRKRRNYLEKNWTQFQIYALAECDRLPNPPTFRESFVRAHFVEICQKFIRETGVRVVQENTKRRYVDPYIQELERRAEQARK